MQHQQRGSRTEDRTLEKSFRRPTFFLLKISRKKTEYLRFLDGRDEEVRLQGEIIKRVDRFKYLGSTVAEDGNLDAEIAHRIQCGWRNWKKYVSGVLCDQRISVKVKGKVSQCTQPQGQITCVIGTVKLLVQYNI